MSEFSQYQVFAALSLLSRSQRAKWVLQCFGTQFLTYLKVNIPSTQPPGLLVVLPTCQNNMTRSQESTASTFRAVLKLHKQSSTPAPQVFYGPDHSGSSAADRDNREKNKCESTFISCASVNWRGLFGVGPWGFFYFSGLLKRKHKENNSLQAGVQE